MTRFSRLALCALLLPLAACDSNDEDDDNGLAPNTFTLGVDRAAAVTRPDAYNGTASGTDGQRQFTILLGGRPGDESENRDQPALAFVRLGASRPGVARYTLPALTDLSVDPPEGSFIAVYIDPDRTDEDDPFAGLSVSTGGTLTVESSSSERVSGSFTATVRGINFFTGQFSGATTRIEGTFNAVASDDFDTGSPLGIKATVAPRRWSTPALEALGL